MDCGYLYPSDTAIKFHHGPQSVLYTYFPYFLLVGAFSGEGALSLLVSTRFVADPTSYSPKTVKFASSTNFSAISSTYTNFTHSSKVPSLKNSCISPSVVNYHHLSILYGSIRASLSYAQLVISIAHNTDDDKFIS